MCGIAGFVYKSKSDLSLVKNMGDSIRYRGPDDHGEFLEPYEGDAMVGLAHRRLAILDLSALGHQPMLTPDQKVIIIFNGEIYNFESIRATLEEKGYSFRSHSDTEVILAAYQEWGMSFIHHLNGMFAIALYNRETKDFYLIRDRMGVKPLYYYQDEKGIIFGSELKPLMCHPGFKKTINKPALSLFLYHGYITAPHTIFDHTYKLEPGTYLHFKNGKSTTTRYWSLEEKFKERRVRHQSETEWVGELDALLGDAVAKRLISDVPIGCFLSGGIDSSLIAALMQKHSTSPIKTFTIGFDRPDYDEAPYAKKVAHHLGTNHYEVYLTSADAQKIIPDIPYHYDEPFADSSQIPSMLLSHITRKHVTVALSGDGGDELFCGYGRYEDVMKLKNLSKASQVANKVPFLRASIKALTTNSKCTQFFELTDDHAIINSGYLNYLRHSSLIKNHTPVFDSSYDTIMHASGDFQEKHMLQDMVTYLPDDILTKVDRASMAFSLEARPPFIDDHRVIEFSFDMPHNLKYKDKQTKYILKKLLHTYLPSSLVDRPKMGFGLPIYDWLRGDLRSLVDTYLGSDFLKAQGIFDEKEVRRLKERFFKQNDSSHFSKLVPAYAHLKKDGFVDRTIWYLVVFQMWYEKFMSDRLTSSR